MAGTGTALLPGTASVLSVSVRLQLARAYECAYPLPMVEWDSGKAASNLRKHGVDFADAATVLHDEFALTIEDDDPDEHRSVTIGQDALGRVLVVVYAWAGDEPRLISARKATSRPPCRMTCWSAWPCANTIAGWPSG